MIVDRETLIKAYEECEQLLSKSLKNNELFQDPFRVVRLEQLRAICKGGLGIMSMVSGGNFLTAVQKDNLERRIRFVQGALWGMAEFPGQVPDFLVDGRVI